MTDVEVTAAIISGIIIAMAIFGVGVYYVVAEIERRLGRELTTLELLAFTFCLPHSLLLLLLLPDVQKRPKR